MKIAIINGSPRKKGNTAKMLQECMEGAQAAGATCDFVNLYSLDFKGCTSCLQCKRQDERYSGKCAMKDGLTPLLEAIPDYDGIVLGSPVYLGTETGEMRSFLERLVYPYLTYTPNYDSLFPKKIKTGLIYTMNVDEERMKAMQYAPFMDRTQSYLERFFGSCERVVANNTTLISDREKYLDTAFDPEAKAKARAELFPKQLQAAREMGERMATAD